MIIAFLLFLLFSVFFQVTDSLIDFSAMFSTVYQRIPDIAISEVSERLQG